MASKSAVAAKMSEAERAGGDIVLRPRGRSPVERATIIALCLLVGWFNLWTVRSTGWQWRFGREQEDYYNRLIDGWLDGHLHMKVEVPKALLALKDPYDPRQRPPGLGLHDASLYRGHYYIYFGAAPVVTLMYPFRLITGMDLPLPVAVLVFAYGGFLAAAGVWLGLQRRFFPDTGAFVIGLGLLAVGATSLEPVLLRRPEMWELPIAAGYCFAMLTLWCVWRSVQSAQRRGGWYAGAGLCLGLAIAARPTYVFAAPLLAVPLLIWWRLERRLPWRAAVAAAVPLLAIGALVALHNYLRFDDPLEFGQKYQLTYYDERKVAHFSARYIGFNAWRYFLSAAEWQWYFPFIQPAPLPPKPAGFSGHDDVFGLLRNLPFTWFALAVPLAWWRRSAEDRAPLLAWLGAVAVAFVGMAGVLSCFFGSLARYQVDFAPTLALLAAIGLLALDRALRARGVLVRWLGRAVATGLVVGSVGFGVLYSLQLDSLLLERNPREYRSVARRFDRFGYLLERIVHGRYGPMELTLRLAPLPPGTKQTVLTTGFAPDESRIFIRYEDEAHVRVGCEGASGPPQISRPFAVNWSEPHRLHIAMGALYPPETHPYFDRLAPAEIAAHTRSLRVEFDGDPVLDAFMRLIESTRGNVRTGAAAAAGPSDVFTGDVLGVRRTGATFGRAPLRHGDFVRLWAQLASTPDTQPQPLVKAGEGRAATEVYLRALDDARMVLGVRAPNVERTESEPFSFRPGTVVPIVLRFDPARPPMAPAMQAWVDGTLTWTTALPSVATPITLAAESTGLGPQRIRVLAWQHTEDGTDPLVRPGALKLRVTFPAGRTGEREPLLVSGRSGQADLFAVQYVDSQHVRFAFDHWGSVLASSEPVAIDYAQPHEVWVDLGFGGEPADPMAETALRMEDLVVKLDGREVWRYRSHFYNAAREELVIGRNAVGGTSCAARFSGSVLGVERVPRE